jgi:hypothetical protein
VPEGHVPAGCQCGVEANASAAPVLSARHAESIGRRRAATPAKTRSTVSVISVHCGSVGTAAITMVGSLAVGIMMTSPPSDSPTLFVQVPLTVGITVKVIGKADAPGPIGMMLDLPQTRVSPFGGPRSSRTHDQSLPVADTNVNGRLVKPSVTSIAPVLAVPPMLDTTMV